MRKAVVAVSTSLLALALAAGAHLPGVTAAAVSAPDGAAAAGQDAGSGRSLQIRVSSTQRTYACEGNSIDSIQVTGSSNMLTITGDCGTLQVTGSSNMITIDSVKTLGFTGNSNSVLYRRGSRPTFSDDGQGNSLGRASGAAVAAPHNNGSGGDATASSSQNGTEDASVSVGGIVSSAQQAANAASQAAAATAGAVNAVQVQGNVVNINLSHHQTTQDCGDGRNVNINGFQNDITLTGCCGKITMNGWGNTIHVDEVASIEIMGHTNMLFWKHGRNAARPRVQIDSGENNSVRHQTASE